MKKKHTVRNVIIVVIALVIIVSALGGKGSKNSNSKTNTKVGVETAEETTVAIEYAPCNVSEMMSDLKANAMNASDKYKGKYLEVTGKLSNIDSSGKYIDLLPDEDFAIIGVQCYIKSDEQKDAIKKMAIGDTVTLKGKCTSVGEVLGYTLDIDSIG